MRIIPIEFMNSVEYVTTRSLTIIIAPGRYHFFHEYIFSLFTEVCGDHTISRNWVINFGYKSWIFIFWLLRQFSTNQLSDVLSFAIRRAEQRIIYIIEHRKLRAHQLLIKKIIFRSLVCDVSVCVCVSLRLPQWALSKIYSPKEWENIVRKRLINSIFPRTLSLIIIIIHPLAVIVNFQERNKRSKFAYLLSLTIFVSLGSTRARLHKCVWFSFRNRPRRHRNLHNYQWNGHFRRTPLAKKMHMTTLVKLINHLNRPIDAPKSEFHSIIERWISRNNRIDSLFEIFAEACPPTISCFNRILINFLWNP